MVESSPLLISTYLSVAFGVMLVGSSQAEEDYSQNNVLLAITYDHGKVAAGMMCGEVDAARIGGMSFSLETQRQAMQDGICRPQSSSILNPDVLAFEVTGWSRQEIVELVTKLYRTRDPLNYDFSRVRLAGHRVRKVDESRGEDSLERPVFDFSFGCYLLIKVPTSDTFPGS